MRRIAGWRGLAVDLDGPDHVVAEIVAQLPPFYDEAGTVAAEAVVRADADGLALTLPDDLDYAGPESAETLRAIASRIELFVVSRFTDLAVVHAGVVAVDGRAIVLPGTSMRGKSTLVQALLATGATYLSDEYALLTPDGRVLPYPRRMTIRGVGRVVPSSRSAVDAPSLPVGVVALLTYAAGTTEEPPRISAAQAVLGLVENGVNVRAVPEVSMTAYAAAAQDAVCLRGPRGDATTVATWLAHLQR